MGPINGFHQRVSSMGSIHRDPLARKGVSSTYGENHCFLEK